MVYLFYILLTTPLWYWIYLGLAGGLGVEPLETLSVHTGFVTITLFLLNLWLGVGIFFRLKFLKWWYSRRRALGIATGLYAILHFTVYLAQEGFALQAWEQIRDKTYLTVAFGALIIITAMLLTSNNFSVRKMGIKKWKILHRFVHVAALLILAHVLLIEKANIPLLLAMTVSIIPFQIWRLASWLK